MVKTDCLSLYDGTGRELSLDLRFLLEKAILYVGQKNVDEYTPDYDISGKIRQTYCGLIADIKEFVKYLMKGKKSRTYTWAYGKHLHQEISPDEFNKVLAILEKNRAQQEREQPILDRISKHRIEIMKLEEELKDVK